MSIVKNIAAIMVAVIGLTGCATDGLRFGTPAEQVTNVKRMESESKVADSEVATAENQLEESKSKETLAEMVEAKPEVLPTVKRIVPEFVPKNIQKQITEVAQKRLQSKRSKAQELHAKLMAATAPLMEGGTLVYDKGLDEPGLKDVLYVPQYYMEKFNLENGKAYRIEKGTGINANHHYVRIFSYNQTDGKLHLKGSMETFLQMVNINGNRTSNSLVESIAITQWKDREKKVLVTDADIGLKQIHLSRKKGTAGYWLAQDKMWTVDSNPFINIGECLEYTTDDYRGQVYAWKTAHGQQEFTNAVSKALYQSSDELQELKGDLPEYRQKVEVSVTIEKPKVVDGAFCAPGQKPVDVQFVQWKIEKVFSKHFGKEVNKCQKSNYSAADISYFHVVWGHLEIVEEGVRSKCDQSNGQASFYGTVGDGFDDGLMANGQPMSITSLGCADFKAKKNYSETRVVGQSIQMLVNIDDKGLFAFCRNVDGGPYLYTGLDGLGDEYDNQRRLVDVNPAVANVLFGRWKNGGMKMGANISRIYAYTPDTGWQNKDVYNGYIKFVSDFVIKKLGLKGNKITQTERFEMVSRISPEVKDTRFLDLIMPSGEQITIAGMLGKEKSVQVASAE